MKKNPKTGQLLESFKIQNSWTQLVLKKKKKIPKLSNQPTPFTKLKYPTHTGTRGVSHFGLAIYIKRVSKGKRRVRKTQIFHHAKMQSSKNPQKRNQNHSRYYNFITNLKFQHRPKYHLSKTLIIKIDLLLLPRGQNPLSCYYTLYNDTKHNILALLGKANKPRWSFYEKSLGAGGMMVQTPKAKPCCLGPL